MRIQFHGKFNVNYVLKYFGWSTQKIFKLHAKNKESKPILCIVQNFTTYTISDLMTFIMGKFRTNIFLQFPRIKSLKSLLLCLQSTRIEYQFFFLFGSTLLKTKPM